MKSLILAVALTASAGAATVVQTQTFEISSTYAGSGMAQVGSATGFTLSAQPFDSSLGTLESFTISWTTGASMTSTVVSNNGGTISATTTGGIFSVNGAPYTSAGGSNNAGGAPGSLLSITVPNLSNTTTYTAANAGVTYNPAILTSITGTTPVAITWDGRATLGYGNAQTAAFNMTSTVVLTYTYTPVPVPETSSLALGTLGLLALLRRRRA